VIELEKVAGTVLERIKSLDPDTKALSSSSLSFLAAAFLVAAKGFTGRLLTGEYLIPIGCSDEDSSTSWNPIGCDGGGSTMRYMSSWSSSSSQISSEDQQNQMFIDSF
jgi:uncharacterized SAM-binding protein YcdF (DUF218 family)